ncbi:MAG TPA: LuxR family transcriptional regulator [Acidimicrobiales bacterium]|nr:LuxR family transcriptional regulator [Acidimicrobiales bacterium]
MIPGGAATFTVGASGRARWPFVGRHGELEGMLAALHDPGTVGLVVHGPPGVGKTRLAEECLAAASTAGWWCVRAVASEGTRQVPLGAVAHLLPPRILLEGGDPLTLFPKVAATVKARGRGRRVVLLVDDLHLLDSTTATLLGQLLSAGLNFLVGTVRTGETVPGVVAGLWRDDRVGRIDLADLSRDALDSLVHLALGGPVAADAIEAVWVASQGNVLFARELVLGAIDTGSLRQERGVWRLDGPLSATARLADALAARLERLDDASLAALDRVALWGPVGLSTLESAADPAAVETLERSGLVRIVAEGRRQHVTLAHPLYGEILRRALPATTRRRVLLDRVRWIEGHGARRRDDIVTIAGTRLDATGSADPKLLTSAAWLARYNHDHVQVERLSRAAIADGVTPEAGLLLGEALHELARYEEADRVLAAALGAVERDDTRLFTPLAEMQVRNLMWGLQRPADATATLAALRDSAGDPAVRIELAAEEAMILSYSGRPLEALALLDGLGRLDDLRARVIAAIAAQPALIATGQFERAIDVGGAAYGDHRRLGDHAAMAGPGVHLIFRIQALASSGRLAESSSLALRAYEAIPREAPANAALWFVVSLGRNALLAGRLEAARRWLEEGVARCQGRTGGPRRVVLSLLATAAAWMGDRDAATAAVDDVDALDPSGYLPGEQVLGPAWAAAVGGDLPRAIAMLVGAADEVEGTGHRFMAAWLLHDACRLGRHDLADRLDALADQCDGDLVAAWAVHAGAAASGQPDRLVSAADRFEAIGALLFAAEASTGAAHAFQRHGQQRAGAAQRARAAALLTSCESARTPGLVTADSPVPLTRREREICVLAARGTSSPEIAARLYLSVRTVNNHLQRAYTKLGVSHRAELADALALVSGESVNG